MREEERDRCCRSQGQTIDATEGGLTPCWRGGVSHIYYMPCRVSRSLRSVPVRGWKVGVCATCCPFSYLHPPRDQRHKFWVLARNQATATPAPDYTTSISGLVSVEPSSGHCLQQRTNHVFAMAERVSLPISNSRSSAETLPPCLETKKSFDTHVYEYQKIRIFPDMVTGSTTLSG